MTAEFKVKDNHFCVPIPDLFYLIHEAMEDEFDAEQFVEHLGWVPQIHKKVIDMLKNEFARPTVNQSIHEEREELLKAMGREEIKYYADKFARMIESSKRWEKDYFKLYHHFQENGRYIPEDFPVPKTGEIDFDYMRSLEKIFGKHFEENLK